MKTIILPIEKKWYDMILSGEKKEEYREIKLYYETRFQNLFCTVDGLIMGKSKSTLNEWLRTDLVFELNVRFRNGYSADSPSFLANCILRRQREARMGSRTGQRILYLKDQRH